jgi:hypothetical protein
VGFSLFYSHVWGYVYINYCFVVFVSRVFTFNCCVWGLKPCVKSWFLFCVLTSYFFTQVFDFVTIACMGLYCSHLILKKNNWVQVFHSFIITCIRITCSYVNIKGAYYFSHECFFGHKLEVDFLTIFVISCLNWFCTYISFCYEIPIHSMVTNLLCIMFLRLNVIYVFLQIPILTWW